MLIIVGIYLALTVVIGASLSGRVKSVTDYLIAGRGLGLVLTTASLAAVQIGAGVVLGGAETGAKYGLPSPIKGGPPMVMYGGECWYEGSCVDHCPVPGAITLNTLMFNRVHWELSGPPIV